MFAGHMLELRALVLLLALASTAAVPVRPSLHGLSPLLPAIARSRRRGPAPLAAHARSPAVSTKLEVLDTAAQLAVSVATSQLTQAMRLKAMNDRQLNEEEYASLISLAGASPTLSPPSPSPAPPSPSPPPPSPPAPSPPPSSPPPSLDSLAGAADNWQLAVSLLRERDEHGLSLSAPTHLAALWACARAAQVRSR